MSKQLPNDSLIVEAVADLIERLINDGDKKNTDALRSVSQTSRSAPGTPSPDENREKHNTARALHVQIITE